MGLMDSLLSHGGSAGSVAEDVGDVVGRPNDSGRSDGDPFERTFRPKHFDNFGGQMEAGQFNRLGTYVVPAGTEAAWGFGKAKNPENQGYIDAELKQSDGTVVEGTLRLAQSSPTERDWEAVKDLDTNDLADSTATSRDERKPLPEQVEYDVAEQDEKLLLEFEPETSATVDEAETFLRVPVTEYDL